MELPVRLSEIPAESAHQYPLTSQQRDPNQTERNFRHVVPTAWRIKGELRIGALMGALDDVVERHEALRTLIHYDESDGSLGYQEIRPPAPVPFTVHEIPTEPGPSRDEIAVDLYVKLHEEGLEYSVIPSLRAALYRFDDGDAVLTLLTHHLFSDNWSIGVLRREIAACYNARVDGVPAALPAPAQYREYAAWEHEYLHSDKAAAARRFWLDNLAGARIFAFPADRPNDPATLTARTAVREFLISAADSAKITAGATRNRCTAWHLILTAGMVLAEQITGSSDITLLTVNNGRVVRDFHNTIGFFANLVPLRVEAGGCASFKELMLLVRKASVDAHQNMLPFGELLELAPELMKPLEDPRAVPMAFNYVRPAVALAEIQLAGGVTPVIPPEEVPTMYHRGTCSWGLAGLRSGELRFVIEYEPSAIDPGTIDRWGSDFVDLLMAIAGRPDQAWRNWR